MSENSDLIEWYIARDGHQHGPLSQDELNKFIEFGHLKPTDLLWRAGFPEWRLASDVFQGPPPEAAGDVPPSSDAQSIPHRDSGGADGDDAGGASEASHAAPARESSHSHQTRGPEGAAAAHSPAERPAPSQSDTQGRLRQPLSLADKWQQAEQRARREDKGPTPEANNDAFSARPTMRHEAMPGARPSPHPGSGAASGHQQDIDEDDDYDDDGRQSSWLAIAATIVILGLIGAGGWFAYNNQDEIAALYSDMMSSGKTDNDDITIVRAPEAASRSAAADSERQSQTGSLTAVKPAPLPQTASISPPKAVSADGEQLAGVPVLKSDAWAFAEREFPSWAGKQLDAARAAAAAGQSPEAINGQLVDAFVAFRRDNAALALLASPKSLESIATAFVGSLRALTARGAEGCYAFISSGEGTDQLAPVYFEPQVEEKIDAQMLAIMAAIVEAKLKPMARSPPKAEDFEKLAGELSQRGWSDADLKLFSNPDALSRAEPKVVCRLVTEWFSAQTELTDREARDRLIAASLRPVIGG